MTVISSEIHFLRSPNFVGTEVGGEMVMLSIDRGEYYSIGGIGTRVWKLLEHPVSVSDIVQTVCAEFDVDEVFCQVDIVKHIDELQSNGLVTQVSAQPR